MSASAPTLAQTARKELIRVSFLLPSILIAIGYIICTIYLLNYRLILQTTLGAYSARYKTSLLLILLQGAWITFSPLEFFLLVLNAVLVGMNVVLVSRSIKRLKDQGTLQLSIGGATVIALITAGCGSCGFSILALLGLSTSFSFLPFKGFELHILATITLLFSFFYMLKQLHEKVYCKVPNTKR